MWFDAKAALKEIRAAESQTLQQQDCSQNAEPINGISRISSLGLSNCKNSHLRENDENHFFDAVKAAFDDYYSLDKFSPDAWR